MEENKVKLTDEEQEIKNLINFFLKQKDEYELNGLETTYRYLQNDEEKKNWWLDGVKYNQKAHAIMHFLAKKNILNLLNSGLQLWIYLAIKDATKKSVEYVENYFKKLNNIKNYDHNKSGNPGNSCVNSNLKELIKNNNNIFQNISYENNINTLLDYVELYFSKKSNFSSNNDYSSFNEPILNNLYNWYLKDITNPVEINTYCNKLENIVNNMEQLLKNEKKSNIKKCNLICTIAKTKIIINKLINSKYNIDEELELIAKLTEENFTTYTSVAKKLKEEFKSSH
ncbi:hypothetical protein [Faecalibacillus intestinalis]|uniref:hypothetical protein n=1 Tax=Faecalibacillus intestinalis TaxID=1982626 RepID=UPI0022E07237|nr:hypothetical protein [Faecalibacillus intestinalis]